MEQKEQNGLSRRDFLKKAGIGVGVAAGALALSSTPLFAETAASGTVAEEAFPLAILDPEEARRRGHAGYYMGGCAFGTFYAILSLLREKVGGPYNQVPYRMLSYGKAGAVGWGTLCGCLNGASAVITLGVKNADYAKIINELIGWYTITPLPTEAANKIGAAGGYTLTTNKKYPTIILAQSTSKSPLCHASVSQWCKAAHLKQGSPERLERCARVTGDTAAKAVELLNAYQQGSFKPVFAIDDETTTCLGCHKDDQVGQMRCLSCHTGH